MATGKKPEIEAKSHLRSIYRAPPDRSDRTDFLRLDRNEGIPGVPEAALAGILRGVTPDLVSTYPQVAPLYERLSRFLSLPEENILVTAGSDAAIKNVFEVFVRPGDGVVIPDPTYAMYEVYAGLFQAKLTKIPYSRDLVLDPGQIVSALATGTRLLALPNPNSPTGTVIPPGDLRDIVDRAGDLGVLVLIDEAYYPYYPETTVTWPGSCPNLVVTRTFSKAFGLASLRVGYAVADPRIIADLRKFRPIYETNGLAVAFASYLLDHPEIVEENLRRAEEGKRILLRESGKLGLFAWPTRANFVNLRVGAATVVPLQEFLGKAGILVKPGHDHPALRDCIRITLGGVPEMEMVMGKIREFLGKRRGRTPRDG